WQPHPTPRRVHVGGGGGSATASESHSESNSYHESDVYTPSEESPPNAAPPTQLEIPREKFSCLRPVSGTDGHDAEESNGRAVGDSKSRHAEGRRTAVGIAEAFSGLPCSRLKRTEEGYLSHAQQEVVGSERGQSLSHRERNEEAVSSASPPLPFSGFRPLLCSKVPHPRSSASQGDGPPKQSKQWPIAWPKGEAAAARAASAAHVSPYASSTPSFSSAPPAAPIAAKTSAAAAKRLPPVSKKRKAEDAEHRAWIQDLELIVPRSDELDWARSMNVLALAFHFADGSSSIRPPTVPSEKCEPYANSQLIVGCSIYSPDSGRAGGRCVHWSIGDGQCEAWRCVLALVQRKSGTIVMPHAQLVMRGIQLMHARQASTSPNIEDGSHWEGALPACPHGAWLDPVILGWLCKPDSTESDLHLPSLLAAYDVPSDPDIWQTETPCRAVHDELGKCAFAAML
ncbi:MAG: hypothetical protein SGPRY_010348, partial [Prymnesium sp.]